MQFPFPLLNLILLFFSLWGYIYLRVTVTTYCRLAKMRKRDIRKNKKGALNYWFFSKLHREHNLGILYYLNLLYLCLLIAFLVACALSWVSFLKTPIAVIGVLLGVVEIPAYVVYLYYDNIELFGVPFVFFRLVKVKLEHRRKWRLYTIFQWLYCVVPLGGYIFLLVARF